MSTWVWVLIVVVVLAVAGVLWVVANRARGHKIEQRREEAGTLRDRSRVRVQRAEQHEAIAEAQQQHAQHERTAAEEATRRAEEVDPDIN